MHFVKEIVKDSLFGCFWIKESSKTLCCLMSKLKMASFLEDWLFSTQSDRFKSFLTCCDRQEKSRPFKKATSFMDL